MDTPKAKLYRVVYREGNFGYHQIVAKGWISTDFETIISIAFTKKIKTYPGDKYPTRKIGFVKSDGYGENARYLVHFEEL